MMWLFIYLGISILSFIFIITCPTFVFYHSEKHDKDLILMQARGNRKIIPTFILSFIPVINVIVTVSCLLLHNVDIDKLNDIIIRGK